MQSDSMDSNTGEISDINPTIAFGHGLFEK